MPGDKRLCLGVITGVHGIKGEVIIRSFTAEPLDIAAYGALTDETGTHPVEISSARAAKKGVIARLRGVTTRDQAEALKGFELHIERDRLPTPDDEDEFYYADLVGLDAVATDGTMFGTVVGLHNFGAGDLIEIRPAGKKATELYPFTKQVVPDISLAQRRLTLIPPASIDDDEGKPIAPKSQ